MGYRLTPEQELEMGCLEELAEREDGDYTAETMRIDYTLSEEELYAPFPDDKDLRFYREEIFGRTLGFVTAFRNFKKVMSSPIFEEYDLITEELVSMRSLTSEEKAYFRDHGPESEENIRETIRREKIRLGHKIANDIWPREPRREESRDYQPPRGKFEDGPWITGPASARYSPDDEETETRVPEFKSLSADRVKIFREQEPELWAMM